MKKLKTLASLILSTSLLLSLSACQSGSSKPGTAESPDIMIGGLAPLTGPVSVYGQATHEGALLAVKEINAAGGINGKPIRFVVYDEKGDPQEAINAYNRLKEEGMVALFGDITSKPSIAVAQRAQDDHLPAISPTPTAAAVTLAGDYIYRATFIDPDQGRMMAKYMKDKLKLSRVAVLSNQSDDYSVGLAEAFQKTAAEIGLQVLATETYANDDSDFSNQLVKIAQSKEVEALYVTDYYQKDMQILLQAKKLGLKIPVFGGDGWDGILTVTSKENPKEADGVVFSTQFTATDSSEIVQKFVKAYQAEYRHEPISFAALGYDSMYMLADAMKRAPSLEGEAIAKALAETKYSGVTGNFTFDQNGDPLKEMTFVRVENGAYQLIDKLVIER